MDVAFQFFAPFVVVEGRGAIATSAKNLLLSESFQRTAKVIGELPEAARVSNPSFDYLLRCREFNITALNRGETASFTFWINSPQSADIPRVLSTTEKAGVKLLSRPADIRPLNIAQLKGAILLGVPCSALCAYGVSLTGLSPLSIAILSLVSGILCGAFGFLLIALLRLIRRLL